MSVKLEKAKLFRLVKTPGTGKDPHDTLVRAEGKPIEVQFNPTSLKISRQNNVDKGGSTTRTQARQNPSTQSAVLTFDLEFDTAEGDANGNAKDVRELTASIRQFVELDVKEPQVRPRPSASSGARFTSAGLSIHSPRTWTIFPLREAAACQGLRVDHRAGSPVGGQIHRPRRRHGHCRHTPRGGWGQVGSRCSTGGQAGPDGSGPGRGKPATYSPGLVRTRPAGGRP